MRRLLSITAIATLVALFGFVEAAPSPARVLPDGAGKGKSGPPSFPARDVPKGSGSVGSGPGGGGTINPFPGGGFGKGSGSPIVIPGGKGSGSVITGGRGPSNDGKGSGSVVIGGKGSGSIVIGGKGSASGSTGGKKSGSVVVGKGSGSSSTNGKGSGSEVKRETPKIEFPPGEKPKVDVAKLLEDKHKGHRGHEQLPLAKLSTYKDGKHEWHTQDGFKSHLQIKNGKISGMDVRDEKGNPVEVIKFRYSKAVGMLDDMEQETAYVSFGPFDPVVIWYVCYAYWNPWCGCWVVYYWPVDYCVIWWGF